MLYAHKEHSSLATSQSPASSKLDHLFAYYPKTAYGFTAQARKNHATLKNSQPFGQTFSNQILPITQGKRFFLFLLLH